MSKCKAENCSNSTYSYDDYCSYHERCLSKLRENYSVINNIRKIETFETWFNKNCGYVVCWSNSSSSECPYYIWIVIYEPMTVLMSENLSAIMYRTHYGSVERAKEVAKELKSSLQNGSFHDTPMVKVHSLADYYRSFDSLITVPYVIRKELHHKISEPSLYFKPLDIVKVDEGDYRHVGVYIGNDLVCHFSKKYNGVRIHSWSIFLEDYHKGNGTIVRYHPMIPFKYFRKIARQIAWARERELREDNYSLTDRNCEHFANMIVYGINYSEQIENNRGSFVSKNFGAAFLGGLSSLAWNNYSINNGKGSTIKLTNEMSETDDKLGWISNDRSEAIERRYLQEVPPKENCRIM